MSQFLALNSFAAPQPLSVGNVVSVAVQLYRKHFKTYLRIAFFATLWSLVPVYGWAKFVSGLAHICRMASFELAGQTAESEQEASRLVDGRKWVLLRMVILQVLAIGGLVFAALLVVVVVAGGLTFVLVVSKVLSIDILRTETGASVVAIGAVTVFLLCYMTPTLFFLSRWFVAEPCIAVEPDLKARASLHRSWQLSKGSLWRMQLLMLVAYLVTLPAYVIGAVPDLVLPDASQAVQQGDFSSLPLSILVRLLVYLFTTTLAAPFWQTLAAALYVDLRHRREGLGLQLTNPEVDWS